MRKSSLRQEFKSAFSVLMLDKHEMNALAHDEQRTLWALFFLLFPVVVNLLLASMTVGHFSNFHFHTLVGGLVIAILAIFVANYIADKAFGGSCSYMGFFRVIGHASFVGWLNIITYLFFLFGIAGLAGLRSTISFIVGIWTLVIFYKALRHLHNLKDFDAATVILATIVCVLIVQNLFFRIVG